MIGRGFDKTWIFTEIKRRLQDISSWKDSRYDEEILRVMGLEHWEQTHHMG
jgi:hypothetical protein